MTENSPQFVPLSGYEEHNLLEKLSQYVSIGGKRKQNEDLSSSKEAHEQEIKIRRLHRKLQVRREQRRNGIRNFDLNSEILKLRNPEERLDQNGKNFQMGMKMLDKYKSNEKSEPTANVMCLVPQPISCSVTSSYTGRVLKPFVRRDFETLTPKLKLHAELRKKVLPNETFVQYPIDFCYVQRQHVTAVNRLACQFFWPGIDVSEALEHPDFSCVALYRQLVVGFAFLLPNVSHTEAYVSFILVHPEWRRSGIAKFLIYHLIQTCAGKDLILHVSANSPAVMIYQQFGFKVEERIAGFYEKYLPAESNECRDALFMRLTR